MKELKLQKNYLHKLKIQTATSKSNTEVARYATEHDIITRSTIEYGNTK